MRLMTSEGYVTRTTLALPDLYFGFQHPDAPYNVHIVRDGWQLGEATYRRITAQSPYFAGRFLVRATKDQITSTLKLRVDETSQARLWEAIDTLVSAFTQPTYDLTININGQYFQYTCEAADYQLGESGPQDLMLRSNTQHLTFSIPHRPAAAGNFGSAGYQGNGTHAVIE